MKKEKKLEALIYIAFIVFIILIMSIAFDMTYLMSVLIFVFFMIMGFITILII